MNADVYKTLTDKERLMYDEMFHFCKRFSDRQDEIVTLLKDLLKEVDDTP